MTEKKDLHECYPELMKIVDLVSGQNPLQRKRIDTFIRKQDSQYGEFAEELSHTLNHSFLKNEEDKIEAAHAYNRMCMDFVSEQVRFKKTGTYLLENAGAAREAVYSQPEVMRYYMIGALLSYIFWPNHYAMIKFFKEHMQNVQIKNHLEIGAGHGLFLSEVMRRFPDASLTVVDISETSIKLAKEILKCYNLDPDRVQFTHGDFFSIPLQEGTYDFIAMGEVLEHVDDAKGFMARGYQLMKPGGTAYMSTCANCPAIDHVYHFHNIEEIRSLVTEIGFHIVKDEAMAAEDIPEELWEASLVDVNYCTILKR